MNRAESTERLKETTLAEQRSHSFFLGKSGMAYLEATSDGVSMAEGKRAFQGEQK